MQPDILWSAVLEGAPPSIKNSRQHVPAVSKDGKKYVRSIKSDGAQGWMDNAIRAIGYTCRPSEPITADVSLFAQVYYKNRRPDLCVGLLMDTLQKAGVIANDRQVRRIIAEAHVDRERPRVAVMLSPMAEAKADVVRMPTRTRIGRAAA